MSDLPILSILLAVPMIAALACLYVKADAARWIALIATLLDLALGAWLWSAYDPAGTQWQFVEYVAFGGGPAWALGIDGIALMLLMLTLFLMPICIGASWKAIDRRAGVIAASLPWSADALGVRAQISAVHSSSRRPIPRYRSSLWGGADISGEL